jgi:hypothetical protein
MKKFAAKNVQSFQLIFKISYLLSYISDMRHKETCWCTGALAEGVLYNAREDDKVQAKISHLYGFASQAARSLPNLAMRARISTLRPASFLFLK